MKPRQAGFTLTELMVVVAIVGVLVTMAVVYMRPRVRPIDVAARLGDLVHEASRRAVALGPVRAEVATALGSKARTQILVQTVATNPPVPGVPTTLRFTLYRLEEAPAGPSGTWMPIESYDVHSNVVAAKWGPAVGNKTMTGLSTVWDTPLPPPDPLPAPGLVIKCKPDGTCDPRTLFFEASTAGPSCETATTPLFEQCASLAVMPLGGAITTRPDWN